MKKFIGTIVKLRARSSALGPHAMNLPRKPVHETHASVSAAIAQ
jgi:hypothetical protein